MNYKLLFCLTIFAFNLFSMESPRTRKSVVSNFKNQNSYIVEVEEKIKFSFSDTSDIYDILFGLNLDFGRIKDRPQTLIAYIKKFIDLEFIDEDKKVELFKLFYDQLPKSEKKIFETVLKQAGIYLEFIKF